jgi:two-component system sensor histidine kinase QseC
MKQFSLRERTLRAFIWPLIIASLLIMVVAGIITFIDISAQHDEEMHKAANLLMLLGQHEAAERDALGDSEASTPMFPKNIRGSFAEYRIRSDSGEVARSTGMPKLSLYATSGFRNVEVADGIWRILTLHQQSAASGGGPITIDVAEPLSARREQTARILLSLALPLALLVAAVAFIGSVQVDKAIRPMISLSRQVDSRDASDLSQIDQEEIPRELTPLVDALNRLLLRLGASIDREREFADNAAHELRTPVAALKIRAQILQKKLQGDPETAKDLAQFVKSVDRASVVIDRLLELARLGDDRIEFSDINLSAAIEDEARLAAPMVLGNGLSFDVSIPPDIQIAGSQEALRIAVLNLLINAAKFTPSGGSVKLTLIDTGEQAIICVTDSGPGVAPEDEDRIFERFWRGKSQSSGSGLGLALVRRVASLHGGNASAHNDRPHGLTVSIALPKKRL